MVPVLCSSSKQTMSYSSMPYHPSHTTPAYAYGPHPTWLCHIVPVLCSCGIWFPILRSCAICPKAWSHLLCYLSPDATSAWSNSLKFAVQGPSPFLTWAETGQLITPVPRRHSRMPGCQSGAACPMGHPVPPEPPQPHTPQSGTPGRCSPPGAFDLLPKNQASCPWPPTRWGAVAAPSPLPGLGHTGVKERAGGWKNLKWIFFLSSFLFFFPFLEYKNNSALI